MNILHRVSKDDLEAVVGEKIANNITLAKEGKMKVQEGGGRSLWKIVWVKFLSIRDADLSIRDAPIWLKILFWGRNFY